MFNGCAAIAKSFPLPYLHLFFEHCVGNTQPAGRYTQSRPATHAEETFLWRGKVTHQRLRTDSQHDYCISLNKGSYTSFNPEVLQTERKDIYKPLANLQKEVGDLKLKLYEHIVSMAESKPNK